MADLTLVRLFFGLQLFLSLVGISAAIIPLQNKTWPTRNYDGQIGFPTYADMGRLINKLDGKFLSAFNPAYANASVTKNLRVMRTPALIVLPQSVKDIQNTVAFAQKYNVHLSIRSSGHSYIGRSTHGGGVVIDMILMKSVDINLNSHRSQAGEVKVQSGASWIEVYEKVDQAVGPDATGSKRIGRVVVGGSAHTVAMGGYTQGGGHAPICRRFGLAVDNLLEATMVTADGKVVTLSAEKTITQDLDGSVTEVNDTSLFWAIRGGGGGTWGVVVSFTYKLHYAPERFRVLLLLYPLFTSTGTPVEMESVKTALTELNKLSEDWGGYILASPSPIAKTSFKGMFLLYLNHYGNDSSPSNHDVDRLIAKTKPIYKTDVKYPTFLAYEVTAKDPPVTNTYIANTFIQPSTVKDKLDHLTDFFYKQVKDGLGCTLTMIGGKVMKSHHRPSTPVHPAFRDGVFSASCGIGWDYNPVADAYYIRKALKMAESLYTLGNGSYFNEPAEDMSDWKERFWADNSTYNRLLDIKKRYDPNNYFWCHNCVGSDLGKGYGPPPRPVHLG